MCQHPASQSDLSLLKDCTVQRTRGSGPGGQHRNKVETAIVITHTPTGIIGQASEARSQNKNKTVAMSRLKTNLAIAFRLDKTEKSTPSELWNSRLKNKKIEVSNKHSDFPALLAEALDFLHFEGFNPAAAAQTLGCSTSQLVKFIKRNPQAIAMVNTKRRSLGLKKIS
ncbi:MAG: peptide chain release factor family protein [Mariniblastus sp.]